MKFAFKLLLIFLFPLLTNAQLNINWINNFCCFDSIAPHTFSVPLGEVFSGDTLVLGYWQDSHLLIKKIDTNNGVDLDSVTAFGGNFQFTDVNYFGGDFIRMADQYRFYATGQAPSVSNIVSLNMGLDLSSLQSVQNSNVTPATFFSKALYSESDTSAFVATYSPLSGLGILRIHDLPGPPAVEYDTVNADAFAKLFTTIFHSSVQNTIAISEHVNGSFETQLRLNVFGIDTAKFSGVIDLPQTLGSDHHLVQIGDTLICAFTDSVNNRTAFTRISLPDSWCDPVPLFSPVADIYGVKNVSISPDSQYIYVRTGTTFSKYDRAFNLIFARTISPSSFDQQNNSNVEFDSNDNPIIGYTFFTNQIANEDLLVLRISKADGATLDSLHYNDARNTADHFLDMYKDPLGQLEIIYCSDYDTMFILSEETQISVIQIGGAALSTNEISNHLSQFMIYPNPASNTIQIIAKAKEFDYEILNAVGHRILNGSSENGNPISLSGLSAGYYIVKLRAEDSVEGKGFIKQ